MQANSALPVAPQIEMPVPPREEKVHTVITGTNG